MLEEEKSLKTRKKEKRGKNKNKTKTKNKKNDFKVKPGGWEGVHYNCGTVCSVETM